MKCNYCGNEAEWVENKEIYGKNYGRSFMTWLCRPCGAYVGCHNNSRIALGTLANKELRQIRIEAHNLMNPLWKSGVYSKTAIYKKLNDYFQKEIHIGQSDIEQCKNIIEILPKLFNFNKAKIQRFISHNGATKLWHLDKTDPRYFQD